MTTYVEKSDSGNVLGMVLLIIAVLAVVGFGIWFFAGYNTGPTTILRDTTTETETITPVPTPVVPDTGTGAGTTVGPEATTDAP